jgi:hypothetical protein
MRKHFTLATLLAALALMVAMSGTAVAAVIISSNHQVAKHTIAGVNAPSGDIQNIIPGSVGRSDLHNGAVNGTKVAAGSLTGANLANGSVGVGKLKLPRISFSGADSDTLDALPHHTVLSLDGVTLGVSCTLAGPPQTTTLWLYVKSSTSGTLRGSFSQGTPNAVVTEQNVDKAVGSTPVLVTGVESSVGQVDVDGQFTYYDKNRVIALTLAGTSSFNTGCDLHGTALPAPN